MSARTQLLVEKIEECKKLLEERKDLDSDKRKEIQTEIVKYEKELVECFNNNKNILLD